MGNHRYVLVTPVRNEAKHLPITISSVTSQTLPPVEWVLVSDGSTDGTNEIAAHAEHLHPWIRLIALPERPHPSFAAVVENVERGIRSLTTTDYDFIGLLDGDVRFDSDYFERLLAKFVESPRLGVAGGVVIDVGLPRTAIPRNRVDVPGAAQMYRRTCFESLGGLLAIPEGGWDPLACAMARMNGFETRLCTDLIVDHLKPRNLSQGGPLRRRWQLGTRDYAMGYHPAFEIVKCLSRLADRPVLVGSLAWFCGYLSYALRRHKRQIPVPLFNFIRREQLGRLLNTSQPAR